MLNHVKYVIAYCMLDLLVPSLFVSSYEIHFSDTLMFQMRGSSTSVIQQIDTFELERPWDQLIESRLKWLT